ncbi:unnamed protein product [Cylindrotheca closterium]|uniref:Uncharacterized protein n=1 Tax=Cylindrotheca closterium TaxID=2856 RepID=A0AAD2CUH3_9STRA|nr:unnamed protein product [Cylindrotheca closterium]
MSRNPLSWVLENLDVGKIGKEERVFVIVDDRAKSPSKALLRRMSKERGQTIKDAMRHADHCSCDETVESMELSPLMSPSLSPKPVSDFQLLPKAAASPKSVILQTSLDD